MAEANVSCTTSGDSAARAAACPAVHRRRLAAARRRAEQHGLELRRRVGTGVFALVTPGADTPTQKLSLGSVEGLLGGFEAVRRDVLGLVREKEAGRA